MRTAPIDRKRLALQMVAPELVSTLVGIIIGVIKYGDDPAMTMTQSVLEWVIFLNTGAVAHQISWLLTIKVFRWKTSSTLRGIWKPTLGGVLLTFAFVYLLHIDENPAAADVRQIFIQVVAVCVIVHIFLFQFNFYAFSDRLFRPKENEECSSDPEPEKDYLSLKIDDRIEKVELSCVSYIKVEDHYCTVIYRKESEWLQWTVYENLKTFEEQYAHRLIRINRSTLVNPDMVERVEKTAGKHLVTMKGDPGSSFSLSSSQKHILDSLIPVIE